MSLPGVNTVIKDRFFTQTRTNTPEGPRVGIIGRRNNNVGGATPSSTDSDIGDLDPYSATDESAVIAAFGAQSDLHRGFLEAVSGGATRVILIALPQDTVFNHTLGTVNSASYTSGDLFDDAFGAAESVGVDIIVPWGRGGHPEDDGWTPSATVNPNLNFGFHANNSALLANSWAAKIAEKCYDITANSHPCFAVLGMAPYIGSSNSDGSIAPVNVATHLTAGGNALTNREAAALASFGPYLSIVQAEISPAGYNSIYDWGFSNGAAIYAGYIVQLDSYSAPTGKIIFNISRIRYTPTRPQQQAIVNFGVVPVGLNYNRQPIWVDAQTFAKPTSDYIRLTTVRIVFNAVQMVRNVSQQFIGEASNTQTRNSLDTAITSGLRSMQGAGALLDSDFNVSYVPAENKAIVDLVLRPAFELRNIEVRVAIDV